MSAPPRRIYLDHNATAPLRPCARAAMEAACTQLLGNPSSPHAEGRAARGLLDEARAQVADLVGAAPSQVVFTSGGTEAINAACHAVTRAEPVGGPRRLVAAGTDHACVLESLVAFADRGGRTALLRVDAAGRLCPEALSAALAEGATALVTHWANNETGVLQDVEQAGRQCATFDVPLVVDAVQAAGKLPISFASLPACGLALSAHKIGGPHGVGALVWESDVAWSPLLRGGHQEHDRRAGTEPVLAAIGFGAAAAEAAREAADYAARLGPLRDRFAAALRAQVSGLVEYGATAPRVANTLCVGFPGWPGETLVQRLDLEGIAAGTGAACAAGAAEPSHVLVAMGCAPAAAAEMVRFSLGLQTTEAEIEEVAQAIGRIAQAWGAGLS